MVIDACGAVPLVKDVVIYLIDNDTSKEIGLEELAVLDIAIKPVPDLNGGSSSTSTSTAIDAPRHAQELREAREEAARSAAEAIRRRRFESRWTCSPSTPTICARASRSCAPKSTSSRCL